MGVVMDIFLSVVKAVPPLFVIFVGIIFIVFGGAGLINCVMMDDVMGKYNKSSWHDYAYFIVIVIVGFGCFPFALWLFGVIFGVEV